MGFAEDLADSVDEILSATWNERKGTVVPKTDDVALKNGAVKLDAVLLYADLADSTGLASLTSRSIAAKVVRSYLSVTSRVVRAANGEIRSFDGDRVMGVFVGDWKNSNAAKCGIKIKYAVSELLEPKIRKKYPTLSKNWTLRHCVGAASGQVLVVRGGVRGSNDLVFIGPAPNIAAKLSEIRNHPYVSYITSQVYGRLNKEAKYSKKDGSNMWTAEKRTIGGESMTVYKSSWQRKP